MSSPRVLMKYFPGAARAGFEFARPSLGYQRGRNSVWTQVPQHQLCDEHYMVDPTTGRLVRTLLLEPAGGTALLLNGDFEGGGDFWGVPLSTSWLGPGAGAEVAITDAGAEVVAVDIFPHTPLSDFGIVPGQTVSAECDMISEAGGDARLAFAWRDSTGANITNVNSGAYTSPVWSRRGVPATQVPANAATIRLYYRATGPGRVRFRNATFGPGAAAPPYHAAAVRHDPARAHGGGRYLEVYAAPGAAGRIDQRETADGASRCYYRVEPGDVATFGGWAQRVSGNGSVRPEIVLVDANLANPIFVATPTTAGAAWTHTERAHTIPAGVAYLYFSDVVPAAGNTIGTTARFDDVYLRILRAGVTVRAADSLTWDPIG